MKIEGFRPERLLEQAAEKGLELRNVRYTCQTCIVCVVTPETLKGLRRIAGARYMITELERKGPGYSVQRFFSLPFKAAGAALVLAIVIIQSFFVRTVEIDGYRGIPETELRQCLTEAGVKEGAYIPGIDWDGATSRIYEVFPQITWVQLVYDGRKVFLNISEADANTEDEEQWLSGETADERPYCNIVAERDGYIEDISVFRGTALVEKGDYVTRGQVLISGRVPLQPTVYDEDQPEEYYVRAAGEIRATVPYRLTFNQERYVRGDSQRDGVIENRREKTQEQAEAKAEQQIRQWMRENLTENAQILNKDLNFSYKENIIEVGVTLEVCLQIGTEQELFIGQENSDRSGS